ncbi:MAG: hypothetical protein M3R61_03405 [Chloroflexota bacterium]|nr:hypothetical protein [Chloroflexota bacterium]
MTTPMLKAVEMTRRIRDQHYEQLKDTTHAERIAFYQQQAQELHIRLRAPLQKQYEAEQTPIESRG